MRNFIRNLVAGLSWRNPLVWGVALPISLLLGLGYEGSRFIAGFFHTTTIDGAGILACLVTYFGLLGIGLAVEGWIKFASAEPPSWLPKANPIMIGGSLCAAFSMVAWQAVWSAGASGSHPQEFWMVMWSTIIMVGLAAFGFGSLSLRARVGKEFFPGVALFLLVFNGGMAMNETTRGSYTTQARWGNLFYAWRTEEGTCEAPPATAQPITLPAPAIGPAAPVVANQPPVPLSAWDIDVGERCDIDIGVFWWCHPVYADRISDCDASRLDYWGDTTERSWVSKWNSSAQAEQAKLQRLVWVDRGFIALVVLAVLARFVFGGSGGGGGISVGKVLGITFLALLCGWTVLCCGGEMVKTLDFLGVDTEVSVFQGSEEGPKLLRPFTLQPNGWMSMGRPEGEISGYLCQCGDTSHQVNIRVDWAVRDRMASYQYNMAPHSCGSMEEFGPAHSYKFWYYGTRPAPVMQVLQVGETLTCPDGSTVSAPALPVPAAPAAAIVPA